MFLGNRSSKKQNPSQKTRKEEGACLGYCGDEHQGEGRCSSTEGISYSVKAEESNTESLRYVAA